MRFCHSLISSILILTTPIPTPGLEALPEPFTELQLAKPLVEPPLHYDDFLQLLEKIESGELESYCSEEQHDRINQLLAFHARQGQLPGESNVEIEEDIQELLGRAPAYNYDLFYGQGEILLCKKPWVKKQWKQTRHFCKKRKKAIIISAAVVVAVAVVVTVVVVSGGTAAGAGAAVLGAAGEALVNKDKDRDSHKEEEVALNTLEAEVSSLKENVEQEQLLETVDPTFPVEESGRILGGLLAQESLIAIGKQNPSTSQVDGPGSIDNAFSTFIYPPNLSSNFKENFYRERGSFALETGYTTQAIFDLDKAINLNPHNPIPYLDRATAYLQKGEYDRSLDDYQRYIEKKPTSLEHVVDFSYGFAKGFPKGAIASGGQMCTFACDCITRPIDTAEEIGHAFVTLSKLAAANEWETIGQALAPEVTELVQNWDHLSPQEQGELAGYAFGKHGTDLLLPAATAKLLAKGAAGAQELATVGKNLKTAEKILALETATGLRTSVKIAEELGFTAHEIAQLENFAKVEGNLHHFARNAQNSVASLESGAKIAEIVRLEKRISEWLGGGAKFIRNEAGDPVFLSKDGLRCVRFDFNKTKPHNHPHAHIEIKVDGKWVKSGQIYPIDVPHN